MLTYCFVNVIIVLALIIGIWCSTFCSGLFLNKEGEKDERCKNIRVAKNLKGVYS